MRRQIPVFKRVRKNLIHVFAGRTVRGGAVTYVYPGRRVGRIRDGVARGELAYMDEIEIFMTGVRFGETS